MKIDLQYCVLLKNVGDDKALQDGLYIKFGQGFYEAFNEYKNKAGVANARNL